MFALTNSRENKYLSELPYNGSILQWSLRPGMESVLVFFGPNCKFTVRDGNPPTLPYF